MEIITEDGQHLALLQSGDSLKLFLDNNLSPVGRVICISEISVGKRVEITFLPENTNFFQKLFGTVKEVKSSIKFQIGTNDFYNLFPTLKGVVVISHNNCNVGRLLSISDIEVGKRLNLRYFWDQVKWVKVSEITQAIITI